jgi:hypothetical protein
MGREVRRVPADWQHPRAGSRYIPLYEGPYEQVLETWQKTFVEWCQVRPQYCPDEDYAPTEEAFRGWYGDPPDREMYMPSWSEQEATHWMMYEDTSKGTPLSPAFATAEECARWCAENGTSAFGDMVADYEWWMNVCRGSAGFGVILTVGEGAKPL